MCSFNDNGKYCVKIPIWKIPEFVQLDNAKSIILNFPANGTAGLERFSDKISNLEPRPPAKIHANVSLIIIPFPYCDNLRYKSI